MDLFVALSGVLRGLTAPVLQHLGAVHGVERVLVVVVALGPLVALAVVAVVARRRD